MKQYRSEQRLLEQSADPDDPLARAMCAALAEDPGPEVLARLAVQVEGAVADGRGPRLADAPSGAGSTAAWLAALGIAAAVAVLLALAFVDGKTQPAPQAVSARVISPGATATPATSPAPRLQAPVESEVIDEPAVPRPRAREQKARPIEPRGALRSADELELLRRAQHALAGDPQGALRFVQEHERAYPDGVLEQERELLAIAALLSLHDHASAQHRAQEFRRTFPHSVHLRRLDRMLAQHGRGADAIGNCGDAGTLTP
jgi:hypothetical protein